MSHKANDLYLEQCEEVYGQMSKRELEDWYARNRKNLMNKSEDELVANIIAEKEYECSECNDTGETWISEDQTQACECTISHFGEDRSDYR